MGGYFWQLFAPRPFRCYHPIRSSPRRSPSACPEKSPKIESPQRQILHVCTDVHTHAVWMAPAQQPSIFGNFRRMPTANAEGLRRIQGVASERPRRGASFRYLQILGVRRRHARRYWKKNQRRVAPAQRTSMRIVFWTGVAGTWRHGAELAMAEVHRAGVPAAWV